MSDPTSRSLEASQVKGGAAEAERRGAAAPRREVAGDVHPVQSIDPLKGLIGANRKK